MTYMAASAAGPEKPLFLPKQKQQFEVLYDFVGVVVLSGIQKARCTSVSRSYLKSNKLKTQSMTFHLEVLYQSELPISKSLNPQVLDHTSEALGAAFHAAAGSVALGWLPCRKRKVQRSSGIGVPDLLILWPMCSVFASVPDAIAA